MLIKVDMAVLDHDLFQSQVVMLLENKLMVYLSVREFRHPSDFLSRKKYYVALMDHSGTFPSTLSLQKEGVREEPSDV